MKASWKGIAGGLFVLLMSAAWAEEAKDPDATVEAVTVEREVVYLNGATPQTDDLKAKASDVLKVVPHLSANEIWKSALMVRSDATYATRVSLEFVDPDGYPAEVSFRDSFGDWHTGTDAVLTLQPYAIFALDFDVVSGWPSFQLFARSSNDDQYYSMEATYNRYENGIKMATVGVPVIQAYDRFLMNMDERFDPFSGYQRFRGLALTNTENSSCQCSAYLYDDGSNGENYDEGYLQEVIIDLPPKGKWVGYIIDLYPDIDDVLRYGYGYIEVYCDRYVTGLGLAFEVDSPAAGSVPIDPIY